MRLLIWSTLLIDYMYIYTGTCSPVADSVDIRFISVLYIEEGAKHETRAYFISMVVCEVAVPHTHQVPCTLTVHLGTMCRC